MSDLERELAVEQAYLDLVNARLDDAEEAARALGDEAIARGALYAEGGVREEDARALYESDVFMHASVVRTAVLRSEREGLLFGRLDLTDGVTRYVGRLGVRDERYDALVLDWRAPAAEPYYRATPLDPRGVVRRRTITSVGRIVTGLDDDLLDAEHVPDGMAFVGDGALLSAMSRTRDEHMGTIVATIQADQDAAIRAPATGTTLITGGPGTGKTVVALHRVAYLLFTDRRRFESGGVLVVGPSAAFVRYIDRVLPSLGEESVVLRSLGDMLNGFSTSRTEHGPATPLKGSLRLLPVLRRAIERSMEPVRMPLTMKASGRTVAVNPGALWRMRAEAFERAEDFDAARAAAERAAIDALFAQARQGSRAEFADAVRHSRTFGRFSRAWFRKPDPRWVWARLHERSFLAECARGVLSDAEVDALSRAWSKGARVTVADVAVLDELVSLSGHFERHDPDEEDVPETATRREPTEFAHVVVDEAQELTPMQWRMLARRGPRASWTVVADRAQSALADRDEAFAAMDAVVAQPRQEFRLGTNYRNPAEIFEFASVALGPQRSDADLPVAARSTGRVPEVRRVSDEEFDAALAQAVRDVLASVAGTVALIGGGDIEAINPRLRTLTPWECKGLEFDGVVVARPERIAVEPDPSVGARSLYVVLTRATQHLVCVTTTDWPAT
ncbi:MAG TPA: UvrD-helicase domain-containing protein [Frankiaceae bacterium]|jgi:DNA helicase IV|nr:UvrD-helicase domain-containing protein [Frankiaceae bacterium]